MSSEMLRVDNLRQRLFCNSVLDAKRESRCPVCGAVFSTTYSMRLHLQTAHMDLEPQNLSAKTFYREFNNNNNNNSVINNNNNNNLTVKSPMKLLANNNNSPERRGAHVTPVKSLYNGDSTCSTDFSDGYPSDKDSYFGTSSSPPKDDVPLSVTGSAGYMSSSHASAKRSGGSGGGGGGNHHVKAKRTYTCRLCSTVFGNLRALKGHNSSSHNKSTNGLYACNICEFASTEKASLNHHMKGHTGETPYVCKKCSYAFTTKANCERHLRTIHKASNAEVKTSILFKNEEKPAAPSSAVNGETAMLISGNGGNGGVKRDDRDRRKTATDAYPTPYYESPGQKSSDEDDYDEPLDLSVKRFKPDFDCEPQDLSINGGKRSSSPSTAPDDEDVIVKPAAAFRGEPFVPHGSPSGYMDMPIPTPLHAYFLNEHRMFFNGMYPNAERMLPIPLTVDMIRAMRQMNEQPAPPIVQEPEVAAPPKSKTPPEPVAVTIAAAPRRSVSPVIASEVVAAVYNKPPKDANGLRLVMKNGILVPKQRRFRTDRPHVCETCKRAFTLKSNRDRHVKNQHPTDWHKKPRSLSKSEPQFAAAKQDHDPAPISDQVKMALSLKCRQPLEQQQQQQQLRADDEPVDDEDEEDDVPEEDKLVIVEEGQDGGGGKPAVEVKEESADLASVSKLLDNASHQTFPQFTRSDEDHNEATSSEEEHSEGTSYSETDGSG